MRRNATDVSTFEADAAAVRRDNAREHVEQRAFAGAVRPDKA